MLDRMQTARLLCSRQVPLLLTVPYRPLYRHYNCIGGYREARSGLEYSEDPDPYFDNVMDRYQGPGCDAINNTRYVDHFWGSIIQV